MQSTRTNRSTSHLARGLAALALFALSTGGCAMFKRMAGSDSRRIGMGDMPGTISKLPIFKVDPLGSAKVEYPVAGKGEYDTFFRDVALSRASQIVATNAVDTLTMSLKNIARTQFAMKEIDNDKDIPDEALAKMAAKKSELSAENRTFIIDAVKNLAVIIEHMNATVSKSNAMVTVGTKLIARVPQDFSGVEAATKAPAVSRGLNASSGTLKDFLKDAPVLIKRATRLMTALQAMS